MITEFVITAGEARKRLDLFLLGRERDISRAHLQRLITLGRVRLNSQVVRPGQKVKPGDRITWDTPQPGPLLIKGDHIPLEILYEDHELLVVNKPPGIVVHPTSGNWTGTLLNALLAHQETGENTGTTNENRRIPGIVHRLDKETSGVMVFAKTPQAHRALAAQFEQHSIYRTYEALIEGSPRTTKGVINVAIGRDRNDPRIVSTNSAHPRHSVTEYRVETRWEKTVSLMRLHPRTGRTHQLRVHLASVGHPILGDQVYGGPRVGHVKGIAIPRIMLHARILGFHHPITGFYQEHEVGYPADMQKIRDAFEM